MLVYNHEYDVTRPVEITPSRNWGGQGALGCTLGFGALHRIPASLEEPPSAPGDTLFAGTSSFDEKRGISPAPGGFESAAPAGDFLIPANLPISPPAKTGSPAPPPAGRAKKARAHHNIAPAAGGGLDDYFNEVSAPEHVYIFPSLDTSPSLSKVGASNNHIIRKNKSLAKSIGLPRL